MTFYETNTILAGRFRVRRHLGSGSFGNTYACVDTTTGKEVALKELDISHVDDWKVIELFEREAKTLERLDHPNIPDYVDFIPAQSGEAAYLAQELAPGSTLDELLAARGRFNQPQAEDVAIQLLQILQYLDSCRPPVIHRDIKPSNILADSQDKYYLVDFGSVVDIACRGASRGSTVAGTFGYMAPEQLHGQVTVASDLYALGMTLIHLVTGRPPEELPRSRMAVQFRDFAPQIDDHFASFLEKLSAPATEDRFHNAEEALEFLETPQPAPQPVRAPAAVAVTVKNTAATSEAQTSLLGPDLLGLFRLMLFFPISVIAFDLVIQIMPDVLNHRVIGGIVTFGFGPLGALATLAVLFVYVFKDGSRRGERLRTESTPGVIVASGTNESNAYVDFSFKAKGHSYTLRDPLHDVFFFWTEERAKKAAAAFVPGTKVTVRYDPENPKNGRFRPLNDSPQAALFADFWWGLPVFAFGIGLSAWYSYYLNSAYYHTGDGGTNIRSGARLESLFHLPITTSLALLVGLAMVVFATILFDRVRDLIPRPISILCGLALIGTALVGTGLHKPSTFFSVENRLHPAHFDRVQAKLPTLREHHCLLEQLQKPEIAGRFGHPVEIDGPFHAEKWEINKGRTELSRRVDIAYRGTIEGPEESGEFYAHIDYESNPYRSTLYIETTVDGESPTVEFEGMYPCEVEE